MEKQSNAMIETDGATKNPLIGHEFRYFGDRFRILRSCRDTDDGSTQADYFAAPGARVPGHVHQDQEERFEVVSGTLGVRVGGRELILGPGQSAAGPAGVPHAWWNPSDDEEVRFLAELRPGLDVEVLLETVLGLARDGKTIGGTVPKNPLQLAVLAHEVGRWAYPAGIPKPVRKALFAPVASLAFAGRMLGYRASYPEYSVPQAAPAESAEPVEVSDSDRLLPLVSVLWLLNSAIGAPIAIREDLPAQFAGMTRWHDPSADFFRGSGTALSPGLPMMAAQAVFTILSKRSGRAGTVGVVGMTALGAGATIGVLGEPITYRTLSPTTFDPAKAPIVSAAVVLSPLMAVLGARRLLTLRSER
jgi:quercetin dioxygenase-like cupin family protein